MSRINPTVTEEAYKIYNELPLKDKKPWVSEAIIEKWRRERGELFTEDQIQWIRKEIASWLSGNE